MLQRETHDTLNFGEGATELETLAAILLALGTIMSIPPLLMFYNLCCKDKERQERAYQPIGVIEEDTDLMEIKSGKNNENWDKGEIEMRQDTF